MAGFGGFERNLSCFKISHLTNQDHLRRLAQGRPQRRRKIFGVVADFALIDRRVLVSMQIFDRVLDRDDVIVLRFR